VKKFLSWMPTIMLTTLAALIIVRLPFWLEHRRQEKASRIISELTPQLAIARCGKPVKDTTALLPVVDTQPVPARHLFYRGKMSRTVLLTFVGAMENENQNTWKLASFKAVIGTNDRSGYLTLQSDQAKIAELPCLSGE
jgi:hypothetical protein